MDELLRLFNRPCRIIDSTSDKIIIAVSFGFFIFLFLWVFEPFGLDAVTLNKPLYFSGYGLITTFVILFNTFVLFKIFKNFFQPEKWTIWKSIVHNFIMILPIALLNWTYFHNCEKPGDLEYSFLNFIFMTFAVGLFPSVFLELYVERHLRRKNELLSRMVNQQVRDRNYSEDKIQNEMVNFSNSSLTLTIDKVLFVNSMGNYVTIYFWDSDEVKKEVIRSTMKTIETDLLNFNKIVRCHKSYFVNLSKVVGTSGNARALYLHLTNIDISIPVSRTFTNQILSRLK
jgi:hypothetical protein